MRSATLGVIFLAGLAAASTGQARAGIIFDYSPGTTGADLEPILTHGSSYAWVNQSNVQNFGHRISFTERVTITGMDIYTLVDSAA